MYLSYYITCAMKQHSLQNQIYLHQSIDTKVFMSGRTKTLFLFNFAIRIIKEDIKIFKLGSSVQSSQDFFRKLIGVDFFFRAILSLSWQRKLFFPLTPNAEIVIKKHLKNGWKNKNGGANAIFMIPIGIFWEIIIRAVYLGGEMVLRLS